MERSNETTKSNHWDDESPDEILGRFLEEHSLDDSTAFESLIARYPRQEPLIRRLALEVRDAFAQRSGGSDEPSIPPRLQLLFTRLRSLDDRDSRRFDPKGEIGRGGMGVVLCIYDHALRRELARKTVRSDRRHGDRAARTIERFIDEAQITAQLDHPGVVPVHDLGLDLDGSPYFTMRRVQGENLRAIFEKVVTQSEGWTIARAVSVLLRVCETMAYAHEKNVIHRDLKPENVMVGRFGEVYVMDWGLARTLGKPDTRDLRIDLGPGMTSEAVTDLRADGAPGEVLITADGAILGTPVYMPPEQAAGQLSNLGKGADVYALGAMLYELLAGHQPYLRPGTTASGRTVLRWILDGPPHPLSQIAPDAPPELIAICEHSMAREAGARYPTMSGFAEDLRAWLEGRVVATYRSGAWAEFSSWVKRNRATALTALSLVLVVVVASGFSAWQFSRQTHAEREAQIERGLRLDIRDADAIIREVQTLWPIHPDSIARFDEWLKRAAEIATRRARPAAASLQSAPEPVLKDSHAVAERKKLQTLVDTIKEIDSRLSAPSIAVADREYLELARSAVNESLEWRTRKASRDVLLRRIAVSDAATDGGLDRNQDALRIAARIDLLADPNIGSIVEIRGRRELAATLEKRSLRDHEERWRETIDTIADPARSPRYGGLRLKPQLGLVPLGADPRSGLHEFWHVLSGEEPARSQDGRLQILGSTGLVFVLVPGGRYEIGAQRADSEKPLYDAAARGDEFARTVELAPYFLSKYEMTLGQWSRIGDSLPSAYHAGYFAGGTVIPNFAHPVESVAWYDVEQTLARWNVDMPTEAQWEAAARAGRLTPSSFDPSDPVSLQSVNVYDPGAGTSGSARDPHQAHAPVASFEPNPFGFHHIIGNVAELCADWYGPEFDPTRVRGTDALHVPAFFEQKAERGGGFLTPEFEARFAQRDRGKPENGRISTGVRPRLRVVE